MVKALYKIVSNQVKPDAKWLYNRVCDMMHRGVKIGDLNPLYSALVREQERFKQDILTKYRIMNPNSTAQLTTYLNDLNDSTVVSICCPNGKWTTNQSALQQLANIGYEFASDILGYRRAKKYADSIKAIRDAADANHFIHPQVTLTKTNRISFSNPPLMGVPKKLLWDCLVPSKPGNIFISADIKNQEPNILINMRNIQSLKPALTSNEGLYEYIFSHIPIKGKLNLIITNGEEPGVMDNDYMAGREDIPPILYSPTIAPFPTIYINGEAVKLIETINLVIPIGGTPEFPKTVRVRTTEGNVYETPIEVDFDFTKATNRKKLNSMGILNLETTLTELHGECIGDVRKEFKRAWNAMTYGSSVMGVQAGCNLIDGKVLYNFFTGIPELKEYRAECNRLASRGTQSVKTYFGTDVYANEHNTSSLKRILLDLPIQGTAADILSLLVKHFDEETAKRGLSDKIWVAFTRHDELIIEASSDFVESAGETEIINLVRDLVEHQVDDWEPFKVDVSVVVGTPRSQLEKLLSDIFSDVKSEY